jgi:hypothetical protein
MPNTRGNISFRQGCVIALVALALSLCSVIASSWAQSSPEAPVVSQDQQAAPSTNIERAPPTEAKEPSIGTASRVNWLSSFEFWISASVLLFGMLTFGVQVVMLRISAFNAEQTTKLFAVSLIIISTLFIITAGFDSEQIAPAMGLFGTVAGYMLGKSQQVDKE